MRSRAARFVHYAALVVVLVSLTRCTGPAGERALTAPHDGAAASVKTVAAPSVTAADPSYGEQGQVSQRVTITGSGFEPGAKAAWERGGVVDPKILVRSTEYVSSTQLVATIDIASDAELTMYDVSVTAFGGSKGIGTEMYEVTQATSIGTLDGSNTLVRGINSRGQATGYSGANTFFWDPDAQRLVDLGPGNGWDIDEAGATIVGVSSGHAAVWTYDGGAWQKTLLPRDARATSSRASSVASDPTTGRAAFIVGEDRLREGHRPRLWRRGPLGWEKVVLPMPIADGSVWANDVNARGQVAGNVIPSKGSRFTVLWEPTESGWAYVAGPGGQGINAAGTITVLAHADVASYMRRLSDGSWTGPHQLPGGCAGAVGVDDEDRIIATRCPDGNRYTGAVFVPPYSEALYLGGLGDRAEGAWVEAISPRGGWIGGTAPTRPVKPGVVWNPFIVF